MNATVDTETTTVETQTTGTQDATAIVDAASLSKALKTVQGAVARKTTLPVLNNVLLSSLDNGNLLSVTGTNLETTIRVIVPGMVNDNFSLTVPHKLFSETAPSKGDVLLTVDSKYRTLRTESGKTITSYKGIDSAEFPIVPTSDSAELVAVIPFALIKRVINEVLECASTDDSRPQLAGVAMWIDESGLITFAAADGFRLARLYGHVAGLDGYIDGGPTAKPGKWIIPGATVAEMDNLDCDNISFYIQPNNVTAHFIGESVEVITRLVEGNYVDINRVIPTDWGTRIVLGVDDLMAACKSLKPFAKDSANIMRLLYHCNKFTGSANASEVGDREVEIPVVSRDPCPGDTDWQVALNLTFVQAICAAQKGKTVALEGKTYQSPIVIRVDDDLLYVIMPMYLPNR